MTSTKVSFPISKPLPNQRTIPSRQNRNIQCASGSNLAQQKRLPRSENVEGDFYVDHTCIDCDTCRWMAPDVFDRVDAQSAVVNQPKNLERRKRAMQALIACPTYSIHMKQQEQGELLKERSNIPILVEGCKTIYHNAYHSESTFAAASWLFLRENKKPVMVDVPRFESALVKRIEDMGGIEFIVISHRDDVGDHEKWAAHFGAKRIIHSGDIGKQIKEAEVILEGSGPWYVDGQEEYEIQHVPGHTEGSIALYHKPEKVLFTGDHIAYSARLQRMTIFRHVNKFSIDAQLQSIVKLIDLDVKRILPAHARPMLFDSKQHYQYQLNSLLAEEGYKGQ